MGSPVTPLASSTTPSGSRRNLILRRVLILRRSLIPGRAILKLITSSYTESLEKQSPASSALYTGTLPCPCPIGVTKIPRPPSWPDNTCAVLKNSGRFRSHTVHLGGNRVFLRITLSFSKQASCYTCSFAAVRQYSSQHVTHSFVHPIDIHRNLP